MKRTKGFTLVELLVVVAIIALLVSILLPTLGKAKELAKQAICGSNLKNIGTGIKMYQAENDDSPPWIDGCSGSNTTGDNAKSLVTPPSASPTALMFLLVRTGQMSVDMFRCPSDDNATKMVTTRFESGSTTYTYWDFYDTEKAGPGAADNCKKVSYSIQAPVYDGANYIAGFTANSLGGLAIMADKTPIFDGKSLSSWDGISEADRKDSMSQNHNSGDFANVLFSDAHVKGGSRADVGIDNDNIYSASGSTTEGSQTSTLITISDHKCGDDSFLIGPIK